MAQPDTTADLDELRAFVAAPAYGSTELHASSLFVPHTRTAASRALDDLVGGGDGGADSQRPLHWVITWVGPMGEAARLALDRSTSSEDVHQICVSAARRLRVGLRYWVQRSNLVGHSIVPRESLFVPRRLPDPGDALGHVRLLDAPERFELTVSRLDVPGRIGRTLLRRDDEHVYDQIVMDGGWLQVIHRNRGRTENIDIRTSDLLGIVRLSGRPLAITSDGPVPLPEFVGSPEKNAVIQEWSYSRILQRLGM